MRPLQTAHPADATDAPAAAPRRRHWSLAQKAALVRQTYAVGMTVSLVAREAGVTESLLFRWRRLDRQGALTARLDGQDMVPAAELSAARAEIARLQRALNRRAMDNRPPKDVTGHTSARR